MILSLLLCWPRRKLYMSHAYRRQVAAGRDAKLTVCHAVEWPADVKLTVCQAAMWAAKESLSATPSGCQTQCLPGRLVPSKCKVYRLPGRQVGGRCKIDRLHGHKMVGTCRISLLPCRQWKAEAVGVASAASDTKIHAIKDQRRQKSSSQQAFDMLSRSKPPQSETPSETPPGTVP